MKSVYPYRVRLKMLLSGFFLTAILVSSCSNPNPHHCKIDPAVLTKNDSILNDKRELKSYYSFLQRTHEPKLQIGSEKAFRLIIHYSFERDCWVYRIKKTAVGGMLTLKKTYKKEYKAYYGVKDTLLVKKIGPAQWKKIADAVNSNCFWTMELFDGRHGLDGASYILEAFAPEADNPIGKKYTLVTRWSPEKETGFRAICDAIEELDQEK